MKKNNMASNNTIAKVFETVLCIPGNVCNKDELNYFVSGWLLLVQFVFPNLYSFFND